MDTIEMTDTVAAPYQSSLETHISRTLADCTECSVCVRECAFLTKYGTPKAIAEGLTSANGNTLTRAFECSLCGLCSILCPQGLDPKDFFFEMRRESANRGLGTYDEHRPLLNYERLGTTRRFTFYGLPGGCTTIFFPGCGLSGSRPAAIKGIFAALRKKDPKIGIVFDCCMRPSYSLGREQHAHTMFGEMKAYLLDHGVKEVLVACCNCHNMFNSLGHELVVKTVYETLANEETRFTGKVQGTVVVHDPCVARDIEPVHEAVRRLLRRQGLTIGEMKHEGKKTLCCGQGGAVNLLAPELAARWGLRRKKEAAGRRIVTYCAGCAQALGNHSATSHVADLLFEPDKALAGKLKGAKAPFTYLNRIVLKWNFSRMKDFSVTRERDFADEEGQKNRSWKLAVFMVLLAAAIISIHLSGATSFLEQERLRALISGYGVLAPVIYMLIYTLAPVLFLPGLPITIVGGILFGPFWGVVYTIFGATCGATLAFLVARYSAREWVSRKIAGPRWEKLDRETATHGWKAVAVVRLIPAFPFNLVNYAFGLTKVSLTHYVVTTFICMLPACIAFIVFSSSLLDLIKGNVSPTFLIGIVLIVLVSLIPLIYRRFKARTTRETTNE